ncbi:MAG: VWA domain-containing protein [Candidatus Omnitrophica bacterium]|nr:VWA domain-containing protein [Candidatus Omnitrophota bacterium]
MPRTRRVLLAFVTGLALVPLVDARSDDTSESHSVFWLIDASGSTGEHGKMEKAKAAVSYAIEHLTPRAEIGIGVFNGCDTIAVPALEFTTDREAALQTIQHISSHGGTPLLESLRQARDYVSAHAAAKPARLIVLTDGSDTCSGGTPMDALYAPRDGFFTTKEVSPPALEEVSSSGQEGVAPAEFPLDPGRWLGYHVESVEGPSGRVVALVETRYEETASGGEPDQVIISQRAWRMESVKPCVVKREECWAPSPDLFWEDEVRVDIQQEPARAYAIKTLWAPWRASSRKRVILDILPEVHRLATSGQ